MPTARLGAKVWFHHWVNTDWTVGCCRQGWATLPSLHELPPPPQQLLLKENDPMSTQPSMEAEGYLGKEGRTILLMALYL